MANEELIKEAKGLGIQNADALTKPQLTKAIEAAKVANAEREALMNRAVELGFDKELLAEFSNENLQKAISEAEEERAATELASKKAELMSEFLGIDYAVATLEEITEAIKNKALSEKAIEIEVVADKVSDGKTDESFKSENGLEFVFSEKAPEKFRFVDVVKTQKDWMKDKVAMELMVQGNLSYLKPKKK